MERKRMDADGGRVVHRERRARKLAVVVALQNLLVAACLLVTLYVYWSVCRDVHEPTLEDNVHIQFESIADISDNTTLKFDHIHSCNMMGLADQSNDKIYVNCTGPYVLYLDVCCKNLHKQNATGILQLQVVGRETPVSSFTLSILSDVCTELHSIAYLRAKEEASLHLYSINGFKVKNMTVGLSYLLGRRCEF